MCGRLWGREWTENSEGEKPRSRETGGNETETETQAAAQKRRERNTPHTRVPKSYYRWRTASQLASGMVGNGTLRKRGRTRGERGSKKEKRGGAMRLSRMRRRFCGERLDVKHARNTAEWNICSCSFWSARGRDRDGATWWLISFGSLLLSCFFLP